MMHRMMRRIVALGMLGVALLPWGCTPERGEGALPADEPGATMPPPKGFAAGGAAALPQDAPAFALPALGSDTLRRSDLQGRVVLLNFWATWCPPCLAEIPELNALHNALTEDGLTVVGVALDEEGWETVAPFAEASSIDYPIVLDDGTVAAQFGGVYGLPTSFVIDREGQVVQRVTGIFPTARMWPLLASLLDLPEDAPLPIELPASQEAAE
jgi:thiol-disulfide isomerase/thioredoxin